jgi:pilus assembly protein CpaE
MRAILISPDQELRMKFESAIADHRGVVLAQVLTEFPSSENLSRAIRAWAPQVVFIALEGLQKLEDVNRQLETDFPWIQRIGLHLWDDPSTLRLALRLHMQEAMVAPFHRNDITDMLKRITTYLERNPTVAAPANRLIAYVPSKAGVGASTIAANATWAFGRIQKTQVLLADFDLSTGIAGFLFKQENEYRITDALSRANELDDDGWQKLVKRIGRVDLLPSGAPCIPENLTGSHVHRVIDFIRRNYEIANVDLPCAFDELSLGVLRDADQIVLVTSSELPAVRMARLKANLFEKLDLASKVRLVVNRTRKGNSLDVPEIQQMVGLPVFASFPNEYADVTRSIHRGAHAPALANSMEAFAEKLLDNKKRERRPHFIERFAIAPIRHAFGGLQLRSGA